MKIIVQILKSPITSQNVWLCVFSWDSNQLLGMLKGEKLATGRKGDVSKHCRRYTLKKFPAAAVCVGIGWTGDPARHSHGVKSIPLGHGAPFC